MSIPRTSSILSRLFIAYLLPTLALLSLFGWLAYRITEHSLEESLGRRLIGIAQATASHLNPDTVLFLSPGDDQSRTAQRLQLKLHTIRERTRVARIFILDSDLRSRGDTFPSTHIGDRHYHAEADRLELKHVFANQEASSVLFRGKDGRIYKTGYAPLLHNDKIIAAVGVEGSAEFYSFLERLRNYLILWGLIVAVLLGFISLLLSRRITHPLRHLAKEAERIGGGHLEHPIQVLSSDEVGLLASTMNKMREGLFQRDQNMQMMLSGIAHEVRNPLGGIELFSGILRDDLQGDTDKLQHVYRIERELQYLKKVVNEFLDYARKSPTTFQEANLAMLLSEVIELLAKDAMEQGITLSLVNGAPVLVHCDAEQLRRVFINLVRNAIQATGSGGKVILSCAANGKHAICEIKDTGQGVPPEVLPKIFTPFFTTREKGTGLGLPLAKKIVEEHGGTLTVESTSSEGTTFHLYLPREQGHVDHINHR